MANEENLKKGKATQFQSGEEAARSGQKGGVASGASRRRRRAMKKAVDTLLGAGLDAGEGEFLEEIVKPRLLALGIDVEDATYQDVLLAGIMLKAMKGDVRAAEFIRDTVGENPTLAFRKQELQLRKNELKFKQEQATKKVESGANGADGGEEETIHIYLPDNGRLGGE